MPGSSGQVSRRDALDEDLEDAAAGEADRERVAVGDAVGLVLRRPVGEHLGAELEERALHAAAAHRADRLAALGHEHRGPGGSRSRAPCPDNGRHRGRLAALVRRHQGRQDLAHGAAPRLTGWSTSGRSDCRIRRGSHNDPMTDVRRADVVHEQISVQEVISLVADRAAGAVVSFSGDVRDHDHGRDVAHLEYEGHPTAAAVIAEVAADIAKRHDIIAIAVLHRVGPVAGRRLGAGGRGERRAPRRGVRRVQRAGRRDQAPAPGVEAPGLHRRHRRVGELRMSPTPLPLVDTYGRVHQDLRVSLTDRCNLRCTYCMPSDFADWLPGPELLSTDELMQVARRRDLARHRRRTPHRRRAAAARRRGRRRTPDQPAAARARGQRDHERPQAHDAGAAAARRRARRASTSASTRSTPRGSRP